MWCQEVADGLRDRGHDVVVLTSRHSDGQSHSDPSWIYRELHLEMDLVSLRNGGRFFIGRKKREEENRAQLRQLTEMFAPDVILVWGMWNLPRSLAAFAETLRPGKVVYYLGDYWPILPPQYEFYWQAPARNWTTYLPKYLLGVLAHRILAAEERPELQFAHALFCSDFLQSHLKCQGVTFQQTKVVYGAIDTSLYTNLACSTNRTADKPLTLLYAGRLRQDKGVHTAIEAVAHLVHQHGVKALQLHIVGTGAPEYVAYLNDVVQKEALERYVRFWGTITKQEMPELYARSDILLFTSIWHEPFGRVLIEAMASGTVVIGTRTGGAAEILIENENALTFAPGDAIGLAAQIVQLSQLPELRQRLAENGRRLAAEKFDIGRMTEEIEAYIEAVMD